MTTLERDLTQSIDETLAAAAQRNEVRVAFVRAMNLSIVSVVGFAILNPATMWLALGWTACAWMIVAVERHQQYRRWVFRVTTYLDALMIASFTGIVAPNQSVALAATALVCTLAAITGAVRLNPWWVRVTTLLAVANVGFASWKHGLEFYEGLLLCLLTIVSGFLGSWLARISRRAIESDVHRVVAGRFLPTEVLDAGYRAPLSALTEARAVDATVLISDIRAFTALAETLPPADVLEFLNGVQGTFAAIVQEHGGSVDKFMGDGMLAVFGVPHPMDDHASRGIAAATAIAHAAESLGVRIGIGLHSGRVVAGVLGSGSRLELTIVGDTVNIASRLESLTKEKQVTALISDAVVERAAQFLLPACGEKVPEGRMRGDSLVCLGATPIRGRANEVVVYTLAGAA